jgi:ribosomal protein S12 methylthiotransferase
MRKKINVSFIGLGCSKNNNDLEYLMGYLADNGCGIVNNIDESDYIVVNTCGFIEPAVSEAIENIVEAGQHKTGGKKLVVTGCMVERYKDQFAAEFPEVDFFTGVHTLDEAAEFILKDSHLFGKRETLPSYSTSRIISNSGYYAYVKISDGCNNRCSYCTIPSIRGHLRSRSIEDIIEEVNGLLMQGVREIILISQDSTKYGMDLYKKSSLVELVEEINSIPGDFFIRLLYLNPDGIDREMILKFAEFTKLIKYFEIPVQHISDNVLNRMNRKSDSYHIRNVFNWVRQIMPEVFIRTTFIVGFPGETEADFNMLKDFIINYKPDFAGFFAFSPEEGTPAWDMSGCIDDDTVENRIHILENLQMKNTEKRLNELKKKEIVSFVEKANDDFEFILEGRSLFQAPEIDGKTYFIDGVATNGWGPYKCSIEKIKYPDIYCRIISEGVT